MKDEERPMGKRIIKRKEAKIGLVYDLLSYSTSLEENESIIGIVEAQKGTVFQIRQQTDRIDEETRAYKPGKFRDVIQYLLKRGEEVKLFPSQLTETEERILEKLLSEDSTISNNAQKWRSGGSRDE